MSKTNLIIVFGLLITQLGVTYAQNEEVSVIEDSIRNKYIQTYNDHFLFKAGISNRSLNLFLFPRENGLTQFLDPVLYRPSVQNTISLGASFKGFGLGFGFRLNQNPLLDAKQGESEYFDIRVVSHGRKVGYDIYYQQYKGYFINDLDDLFTVALSGTTERRRDDMTLKNYAANVYFIAKPDKFSFRAAFVHDERQLKSAGSFVMTGSLGYFEARGDSSLVPTDTDIAFDPSSFYSDTRFYSLSVTPGYAYTLVHRKNFYASLGASGMVGVHYFQATSETLDDQGMSYLLKGIVRASIGYANDKWVVRLAGSSDIQGFNTRYIQYQTNNLDLNFLIAYRLETNWLRGRESLIQFKKKE